ncbi:MAG: OmpH family outer membrane protein [Verrucomicrobia bacterium]|jgi:Skp family chaperone for outer membrane proteins|nr:OmpH family outer membrane protein [Verrucomicrobiota bacterium]
MKRLIRHLMMVSVLVLCTALPAVAQEKIATVDLRKVFDGYWKTKQANAALKERGDEMEKELKGLVADFESGKQEYQTLLESANDQAASITERERRKKKAEDKLKSLREDEQNIQQFQRQARTTIDEQQRRMRDNILEEVKATITSLAKSGGFTLVFDTAADTPNRTPVILYTSDPDDLTDAVLSQLNATAPADMEKEADTSKSSK